MVYTHRRGLGCGQEIGISLGDSPLARRLGADITLKIGPRVDTVLVRDKSASLIQTGGPQQRAVVDDEEITELPLASRNFTQILSLSPGTATYLPDSTAVGRNTQAISVNGARVTQNFFQINGIDATTMGTNGAILVAIPAPETIHEFIVQTSLYDARYGRSGATMTLNGMF